MPSMTDTINKPPDWCHTLLIDSQQTAMQSITNQSRPILFPYAAVVLTRCGGKCTNEFELNGSNGNILYHSWSPCMSNHSHHSGIRMYQVSHTTMRHLTDGCLQLTRIIIIKRCRSTANSDTTCYCAKPSCNAVSKLLISPWYLMANLQNGIKVNYQLRGQKIPQIFRLICRNTR